MSKNTIYAMIPARYGSTRLKMKNLALIDGKPMIGYVVDAAIKSKSFNKVVINSEHKIFNKISERYGVDFYQRPKNLGSSEAMADSVVFDFMKSHPSADIVVWVNPTSPLQTASEISNVVKYFIDAKLDSLITVEDKKVHCNFDDKPINYNPSELFLQTQSLEPVQIFAYSIMMWRSSAFMEDFKKKGYALFCGKFGTYSISKMSGLIVKTKEDLLVVDRVVRNKANSASEEEIKYDSIVNNKVT